MVNSDIKVLCLPRLFNMQTYQYSYYETLCPLEPKVLWIFANACIKFKDMITVK